MLAKRWIVSEGHDEEVSARRGRRFIEGPIPDTYKADNAWRVEQIGNRQAPNIGKFELKATVPPIIPQSCGNLVAVYSVRWLWTSLSPK